MNKKKIFIPLLIVLLLIMGGLSAYKFIKHEKAQNERLMRLESMGATVSYLKEKQRQANNYYEYTTEYNDDSFNYFAIGNSLTLIDGDWGRGICSTRPDNDYFHLVVKNMENQYGKVVAYPYNYAAWERSADRNSCLDLLDVYLSNKLNLVTIQLGENVGDKSTFEQDLESLVAYVHQKAPKAKIIIIGDFWDKEKNALRQTAAQHTNCPFADISAIINDKEYQSEEGKECLRPDGGTIKVSHAAATHPGDKGMEYIANAVIKAIKQ